MDIIAFFALGAVIGLLGGYVLGRYEPKKYWEPSKEQMEALQIIVRYGNKESTNIKNLTSLYEQLKSYSHDNRRLR